MTPVAAARAVLLAVALLPAAATAYAAKTDAVVLRNGDRFTCEVKQLVHGRLKIVTDDAGTIYVEWDKIASITTTLQYEVVTKDDSHFVGVLETDATGRLAVVAQDGTTTALAPLDVVSFSSIKTGFLERIDGTLDFGGNYTHSSGVAQTSLDLDARYRRPRRETFILFESNVTREHDVPAISRFTFQAGYSHFRADHWIVTPFLYVERNADLGLTLRSAAAIAAGRYVQRSYRKSTLVMAGAAVGRERLIEGGTINNLDALVSFATSFYGYDYPRSEAELSVMLFPELNRLGRVRANADARLKYELVKDLLATISAYDTFDSRPQVAHVERNDVGVTLSIGWAF